ncbi:uncharacterized protein LOC119689666 isoform X2 [Teleopsis dalmanni]|nr:uncharacterized protein LOC119689666 isoform X2 [Teleopsis dalmanni]
MPTPYIRIPTLATHFPYQVREIHNAPIRYFRLLSAQSRPLDALTEGQNDENGVSASDSDKQQPEYCETHMYTHENGNTYFVPVLRRGQAIVPIQNYEHPIERSLTAAVENVCSDSTLTSSTCDTHSMAEECDINNEEPVIITNSTSDFDIEHNQESIEISRHPSLLTFCASASDIAVEVIDTQTSIIAKSNNMTCTQLKTVQHMQTKPFRAIASHCLPCGISNPQEYLFPSFHSKRIEAGSSEGVAYMDGIYFQTMEGYFVPSVDINTRHDIQRQFLKQGRPQSEQNLLFARNICDIAFMMIRSFHEPHKKPRNVKGVIISTQTEISYDIGINAGLFLSNCGIKLWFHVNRNMDVDESITPTIAPSDNKLFELFRSSNEVTTKVSELPDPNFVIVITQADNNIELCDKLKMWISTVKAPLFFVDPAVNSQLQTANCHKYAIIPILPIEGFNEYNYMQTFLCNLSVPEKLIKCIIPHYKSPFGVNDIVEITKAEMSSSKTSINQISVEESTKLEFETQLLYEN